MRAGARARRCCVRCRASDRPWQPAPGARCAGGALAACEDRRVGAAPAPLPVRSHGPVRGPARWRRATGRARRRRSGAAPSARLARPPRSPFAPPPVALSKPHGSACAPARARRQRRAPGPAFLTGSAWPELSGWRGRLGGAWRQLSGQQSRSLRQSSRQRWLRPVTSKSTAEAQGSPRSRRGPGDAAG